MNKLILFVIAIIATGCSHKPNLQADCAQIGKDKSGKMLFDCDKL